MGKTRVGRREIREEREDPEGVGIVHIQKPQTPYPPTYIPSTDYSFLNAFFFILTYSLSISISTSVGRL